MQIELTRRSIETSLRAHKLSDVPITLFLSSGVDSTALLALSRRGKLPTLSIGFHEVGYDESVVAEASAAHFGAPHVTEVITQEDASLLVEDFLDATDQPSVDGFNSYCISALTKRQGLKVALSGLGADELFGGYPSFKKIPKLLKLHRRLGILRPALARWLARSNHNKNQRLAHFLRNPASPAAAHHCFRGLFSPAEIARLMQLWGIGQQGAAKPWVAPDLAEPDPQPGQSGFPQLGDAIAWLESSRYMGQQLLRDTDTYSMAHGLEIRLPFVDSHVFRDLSALPSPIRLAPNKQLLREAVPELKAVLNKGKKLGFSFPFQTWFAKEGPIDPLTSSLSIFDKTFPIPPTPADLDIHPWARRWGLMTLNHWLAKHLELELGSPP
jgi:asparagine synthase (glutamine-hydrolysing)